MARASYSINSYTGAATASTLISGISNTGTTLTISGTSANWGSLGSTGGWFGAINYGQPGEEKIYVPSGLYPWASGVVTISGVTRGVDNTTAVPQASGVSFVAPILTSIDLQESNQLVNLTLGGTTTTSGQALLSNGTTLVYGTVASSISGTVAGGDLSGTYPNPTVAAIQGKPISVAQATQLSQAGNVVVVGSGSLPRNFTPGEFTVITGTLSTSSVGSLPTAPANGTINTIFNNGSLSAVTISGGGTDKIAYGNGGSTNYSTFNVPLGATTSLTYSSGVWYGNGSSVYNTGYGTAVYAYFPTLQYPTLTLSTLNSATINYSQFIGYVRQRVTNSATALSSGTPASPSYVSGPYFTYTSNPTYSYPIVVGTTYDTGTGGYSTTLYLQVNNGSTAYLPSSISVDGYQLSASGSTPSLPINGQASPTYTVTAATGNGTTITYTCTNSLISGNVVNVTGLPVTTGASLNLANMSVVTATATQFTVTNTTVGTSVGSGTATPVRSFTTYYQGGTTWTSATPNAYETYTIQIVNPTVYVSIVYLSKVAAGAGTPITGGGTGATTASGALANLGGLPLTGGTISGNLIVASGLTVSGTSTYIGNATFNGSVTVSGNSVLTSASTAGGDLTGTYPNPSISTTLSGVIYTSQNNLTALSGSVSSISGSLVTVSGVAFAASGMAYTISGQLSTVSGYLKNYLPLAGGTLAGNLILNADPTVALGAATKEYVDAVAQGLSPKESVVATASGNVTTSGNVTIDTISIVSGYRVLLIGQSIPSQNGIWLAQNNGVGWTRPLDFASGSSQIGAYTLTEQGPQYKGSGFVMTGGAVTVDSTAETWALFSSAPTGPAGGDLIGTYPNPTIFGTPNVQSIISSNPSVTSISGTLSTTVSNVVSLSGSVSSISGSLTTTNSNVALLSGSLALISGNLVTTNSNLTALSGSVSSISGTLSTTVSNVTLLSGSLSLVSGNLVTTNSNLAALSGSVSSISGSLSTTITNVSTISGVAYQNQANIATQSGYLSTVSGVAGTALNNVATQSGYISTISGYTYGTLTTTANAASGMAYTISGQLATVSGLLKNYLPLTGGTVGPLIVSGSLTVSGTTTLSGGVTIYGATTINNTLTISGGSGLVIASGYGALINTSNAVGTGQTLGLKDINAGNYAAWFRAVSSGSGGGWQTINNAFTNPTFTVTDSGNVTVPGSLTATTVTGTNFLYNANNQTVTYTGTLSDSYAVVMMSGTANTIFIVPSGVYPVGTQLNVLRTTTSGVTISGAAGVTIYSTGATVAVPNLRAQYSSATIFQSASNTWYVMGDVS